MTPLKMADFETGSEYIFHKSLGIYDQPANPAIFEAPGMLSNVERTLLDAVARRDYTGAGPGHFAPN